jgi:hypothetical protein
VTRVVACLTLTIATVALAASSVPRAPVQGAPGDTTHDEAQLLAARVRDRIIESRVQLERYGYFEEDIEIQLDRAGAEVSREARVYAVSPAPPGGEPESRLVSVDGRAPTDDEREEDDERRAEEREEASRESVKARERRREAVEDLRRGLTVRVDGREQVDGRQVTILAFEPRAGARLRSRAGLFIRAMRGRIWVTANGDIVRADAELIDDVSVGWGLIARVWKGASLHARQQPQGGHWLPQDMTAEARGRTLLFRTFRTRYVVRFWGYKLGAPPAQTHLHSGDDDHPQLRRLTGPAVDLRVGRTGADRAAADQDLAGGRP